MKELKTEIKRKINVKWSTLRTYHCRVRGVSTGIVVDRWGWITDRGKMFLFSTAFRRVPGPTQPPRQVSSGVSFTGDEILSKLGLFFI
jgi:hypothetical protein